MYNEQTFEREENRIMCYDNNARPPYPPIAGGAADGEDIILTAADGTRAACGSEARRAAGSVGTAGNACLQLWLVIQPTTTTRSAPAAAIRSAAAGRLDRTGCTLPGLAAASLTMVESICPTFVVDALSRNLWTTRCSMILES